VACRCNSIIQQQNWNPSCSNYIVLGTILIWNCSWTITNLYYRDYFFLIKPTDALFFPNLFLSRNSTCFGQFLCPSSGVLHCTFGTRICHQTCMTYTSVECTVENSWWWADELPETCGVSWKINLEKLVHLLVLLKWNLLRCMVTWT